MTGPAGGYTAPASSVLTVLHVLDPEIPPVSAGPDPTDGVTRCGLPMLTRELWLLVEFTPGDVVCRRCQGGGDEQGALL